MFDDEFLRKEVKALKAFQGITYKEIAEKLEIKQRSMYNYLRGEFDLGAKKKRKLYFIIKQMKGM